MGLLNIDLKKISQYALFAFTHVYGEEYADIIANKINNANIIVYPNSNFSSYIYSIKSSKNRELSVKFLEKIGINVSNCKKESYVNFFDKDVQEAKKIAKYYIGEFAFNESDHYKFIPLLNFNDDTVCEEYSKIELINYIRNDKNNLITKENIKEYIKTEEYAKIKNIIMEAKKVYEELLEEYKEWEKQLFPYEKYIEYEEKRKNKLKNKHIEDFYNSIFIVLPDPLKELLINKPLSEQHKIVLGPSDMCLILSNIECFNKKSMDKLEDSNISLSERLSVIRLQLNFLKTLGIDISNKQILECKTEDDIKEYLKFLNLDEVKKYIPSHEMVEYIIKTKEIKCEDFYKELYMDTEQFKNIIKGNEDNLEFVEHIYKIFKLNSICITNLSTNSNESAWTLFYNIRSSNCGLLFFSIMHELGHIIDSNNNKCGFEDLNNSNETNNYDNRFRKYEKFNETLNDIFTMEAVELIEKQGIYFIEPKQYTLIDYSNSNTSIFNKNILKPLLEKFRKEVIEAKITSNSEILISKIGENNFEELVDIVNKIDDLSKEGLEYKLENEKDNPVVIEYYKQLERARIVYMNIDNYYNEISLIETIDDVLTNTI